MSHHLPHLQNHHLPVAGSKDEPLYAIGARFDSPDALLHAVETLQKNGYSSYECFTPYPLHGLPEAMRLKKSILSFLVLGGGVTAVLIALSMELIPSTLIYPLVVDGKPLNLSALPQYIPITVALTLMIGAITAVVGMILLGGMPRLNNPIFAWDLFATESYRGFFLAIEANDKMFSSATINKLLHDLGGREITAIHQEGPEGR